MGACTKTTVAGLVAPKADTVTWTAPVPIGVHVVNAASQRPAHARPLGAMLRILVSLDWKVKVGERLEFETFWAEAEKVKMLPCCTEVLGAGDNVTLAGNGDGPTVLWPPQPPRAHRASAAIAHAKRPKSELLMHPPRLRV